MPLETSGLSGLREVAKKMALSLRNRLNRNLYGDGAEAHAVPQTATLSESQPPKPEILLRMPGESTFAKGSYGISCDEGAAHELLKILRRTDLSEGLEFQFLSGEPEGNGPDNTYHKVAEIDSTGVVVVRPETMMTRNPNKSSGFDEFLSTSEAEGAMNQKLADQLGEYLAGKLNDRSFLASNGIKAEITALRLIRLQDLTESAASQTSQPLADEVSPSPTP